MQFGINSTLSEWLLIARGEAKYKNWDNTHPHKISTHEYKPPFWLQQPHRVYKHPYKIGTPHEKAPVTVQMELNLLIRLFQT